MKNFTDADESVPISLKTNYIMVICWFSLIFFISENQLKKQQSLSVEPKGQILRKEASKPTLYLRGG